jgi:hypothetical protein
MNAGVYNGSWLPKHSRYNNIFTSDRHGESRPPKPPLEIVLNPSDAAVKKE